MYKNVFYTILRRDFNIKQMCKKFSDMGSTTSSPAGTKKSGFSKEERDEFMSLYPQVRQDLTSIEPYNKLPFFMEQIGAMLDYNLPRGTNARGLQIIYAYKMMAKPEEKTPEKLKEAIMLGWCMRLLEAFICISDDFLDNSLTRNQRPCWYSLPNVGKSGPLHAAFMESCCYYLLKKYFAYHPQYVNMVDIISRTVLYLNYSQSLDVFPYDEKYQTYDFMEATSLGKTAWSSFYTSVTLAMHFVDIQDPELYKKMKKILVTMGFYFQMQNDYLDSFDNPENRELGADIKEARITWLSYVAYNKCSVAQKQLFNENYGKNTSTSVNNIIELYQELEMPKLYEDAERKLHSGILEEVNNLPNDIIPHTLIFRLLNNLQQKLCSF